MKNIRIIEIWKDIPAYSRYQVSNLGRVKSLYKVVNSRSGTRKVPEKILKQALLHTGYYRVGLTSDIDGKSHNHFVHRLVAEAFVPNPKSKEQVNHIDTDKLNNVFSNLEWNTPVENIQHSIKQGINTGRNAAKFDWESIHIIRKLLQTGISANSISKMYSVSKRCILDIKHNITWKIKE